MAAMHETRVAVGVDGSIAAQTAVCWAAAEAALRSATLRVVHAFVWPLFRVPLGPTEVAPGLRAAADLVVGEAVELAGKVEPAIPIEAEVVEGFPFPVLTEESRHADLIVVGSRGLGATLTVLVGSTAVDLVAHAHCPVVVVRPDQLGDSGRRVVVGYDRSPAAARAVRFGVEYSARHDLDLLVATVADDGAVTGAELAGLVASVTDGCRGGVRVTSTVLSGHPAEELVRLSGESRLVVVGCRGRGGFRGLLLGSVSQAVLQHAGCPVAVVPRELERVRI
jgi:nucleotide-binding universal stress UspA family protein